MSEQQLSAAGKAPRPACSGTSACLCCLGCARTAVWVHWNCVLSHWSVPDRGDPTLLSLSWGYLMIPWLQDELSGCWAWKRLSFSCFLSFKLKWSHSPSDSTTRSDWDMEMCGWGGGGGGGCVGSACARCQWSTNETTFVSSEQFPEPQPTACLVCANPATDGGLFKPGLLACLKKLM